MTANRSHPNLGERTYAPQEDYGEGGAQSQHGFEAHWRVRQLVRSYRHLKLQAALVILLHRRGKIK